MRFAALRILLLISLSACCLSMYAQTWDDLQRNKSEWLIGHGYGSSSREADQNALKDVASQIRVKVSSEIMLKSGSTQTQVRNKVKETLTDSLESIISTYSSVTLNNCQRMIIENGPKRYHIVRYISIADVYKVFQEREEKIKYMLKVAEQAERELKIDAALKNFYWAQILINTLPSPSNVTYYDYEGNKQIISVWVPGKISSILDGNIAYELVRLHPELRVVATIFPIYDWAREVMGSVPGIELVWLQDTGVDMHSYQPTAEDMMLLSSCDLFLYVGGTSDSWVDGALQEAVNQEMEVVSLLDVLGDAARLEELTEGMQADHDHDGHDHGGAEYDEHIWLSLQNAELLTGAIADAFGRMDPAHAADFAANAAAYTEQLEALDGQYRAAVEASPVRTVLFGDRFPFRYLVEDYGLDYYAAFPGCSAETEASFETVAFLAGKTAELDLPAVLAIENSDHRVAETIAQNAGNGAAVLTLDSMQGVTAEDAAAGATYLSIMEANLNVLKQALA